MQKTYFYNGNVPTLESLTTLYHSKVANYLAGIAHSNATGYTNARKLFCFCLTSVVMNLKRNLTCSTHKYTIGNE